MQLRHLSDNQELNSLFDTIAKEFDAVNKTIAQLHGQVDNLLVKNVGLSKELARANKQLTVNNRVALKSIKFGETKAANADTNGLYVTPAGVLEFKDKTGTVTQIT